MNSLFLFPYKHNNYAYKTVSHLHTIYVLHIRVKYTSVLKRNKLFRWTWTNNIFVFLKTTNSPLSDLMCLE